MHVEGDFVRPVGAIEFRYLACSRTLGNDGCGGIVPTSLPVPLLKLGRRIVGAINSVREQTVGDQALGPPSRKMAERIVTEGRAVARAAVLATELYLVLAMGDRNIILILEFILVKELRNTNATAQTHIGRVNGQELRNTRGSGIGDVSCPAHLTDLELVQNGWRKRVGPSDAQRLRPVGIFQRWAECIVAATEIE